VTAAAALRRIAELADELEAIYGHELAEDVRSLRRSAARLARASASVPGTDSGAIAAPPSLLIKHEEATPSAAP
jgi:hypothetical protein